MELATLGWVFERLEHWIKRYVDNRAEKSEEEREAFGLFLEALNKTQIYLGRLEKDHGHSDAGEEEDLSVAWTSAANAVREFDNDLYHRCLAKACFWSGSHYFEKTDLAKLNISIDTMIQISMIRN